MPWTKRSLHPSLKLITIAAWWWFFYPTPLSKKETLNILKVFSPNTMIYWAFKKKNQPLLSFMCEVDTYWFLNTKHQITVFNFYLFSYCIKRWLCPNFLSSQFKMYMHSCYLHCSKIHEASVSVILFLYTREINGFQWKRIPVLFETIGIKLLL